MNQLKMISVSVLSVFLMLSIFSCKSSMYSLSNANDKGKDSVNWVNQLLPADYPRKDVLTFKILKGQALLKVHNHSSLNLLYDDPIVNYLLIHESGQIKRSFILYSLEVEDVDLKLFNDQYVFSYYSMPVGYTQYFIFDLERNQLFQTHKIDEAEEIDWESLNLSSLNYRLLDSNSIFLLYPFEESE